MALFRRNSGERPTVDQTGDRPGFAYLPADEIYLDSACQTLRPQSVIDAMTAYYTQYSACGERVKYAWGRQVDDEVEETRERVLRRLGLSGRRFTTSFTLNTTYGINLLLTQLPVGRYRRVVTTRTEHNSVFLPTMALSRRLAVPRLVLDRGADGAVHYGDGDLADAVIVVSAMNNVDGTVLPNLADLVRDAHRVGGIVIVDAAQAFAHAPDALHGIDADAVCFSAHKAYGSSLGVVAARNDLLSSLELGFIGGGQIASVSADDFTLRPELHARLEPGLQAWGEIIALREALAFTTTDAEAIAERETRLAATLYDGLTQLPHVRVVNRAASAVISIIPERVDAHRLATFLSHAGIMVRSGHFCAHHWLQQDYGDSPLVRFSLGAHNTDEDIARTLEVTGRLLTGL